MVGEKAVFRFAWGGVEAMTIHKSQPAHGRRLTGDERFQHKIVVKKVCPN